jgi:hypothetical protein
MNLHFTTWATYLLGYGAFTVPVLRCGAFAVPVLGCGAFAMPVLGCGALFARVVCFVVFVVSVSRHLELVRINLLLLVPGSEF